MKKILTLMFAVCAIAMATQTAEAQVRNVRNVYSFAKTDSSGADTITFTPANYETIIFHTLTDSVHYNIKSTGQCVKGDKVQFVITNTSGTGKFNTIPASGFETTGADSTMQITSSKRATISFIYDGSKFIQTSIIKQ